MDRSHLEPRNRLHQDQRGVHALLRREDGWPPARHGTAQLCQELQARDSREDARGSSLVEEIADGVRELHE